MLSVLTLNIGSLFEADWETRKHEVVAWIDRLDPDIVCLQEVWHDDNHENTAGWIANATGVDYRWVFGGHSVPWQQAANPSFRFGSAVLSRWVIEDHHTFRLPVASDPADEYLTAMPWELVHARTAGLDIFTTHLAAAPSDGRHRVAQVQAIEGHVRELRGTRDDIEEFGRRREHMPAILTGDFNADPDSDEIRFLKGLTTIDTQAVFWQDAWTVAGDTGPGLTQDWRTHELAANLNVHRKRIDYVFVGDPFMRVGDAGRVLSARVVADEPLTGVQASDHCGVFVEIAWPDRPTLN